MADRQTGVRDPIRFLKAREDPPGRIESIDQFMILPASTLIV